MSNRSYDWHGEECHDYDDIINLPHHVSATRPHMSMLDRAAQFSPYAALVGYDDVVKETARLTDTQAELSEQEQELLNKKIALLQTAREQGGKYGERPTVTICYFIPDKRKTGGKYVTVTGRVKRIDAVQRTITLGVGDSGKTADIPMDAVADMTGAILDGTTETENEHEDSLCMEL